MIGKIKGTLTEIHSTRGLIETVSGVSYVVHLVPSFLDKKDQTIQVYTHLQVKDDDLVLFGFIDYEQYWLFTQLISVDGVGPKLGFTITSYAQNEQILQAVEQSDVAFFQSIPGVGKKTAARLVLDLSGKLAKQVGVEALLPSPDDALAVEALTGLGFAQSDILKHLQKLNKTLSLEEKIRQVIVLITKK